MSSGPVEAIVGLSRVLESLGLAWYLFGAQAAILRGVVRLTADVDVTVLATQPTARIVAALEAASFSLRAGNEDDFVARTRILPMVHDPTGLPVDIVLGGPGLEEEFARRAELIEIGNRKIPVATATDLATMKVIAGRPKDLRDVADLLAVAPMPSTATKSGAHWRRWTRRSGRARTSWRSSTVSWPGDAISGRLG